MQNKKGKWRIRGNYQRMHWKDRKYVKRRKIKRGDDQKDKQFKRRNGLNWKKYQWSGRKRVFHIDFHNIEECDSSKGAVQKNIWRSFANAKRFNLVWRSKWNFRNCWEH